MAGLVSHAMLHAHKTPIEDNTLYVISPRFTKSVYRYESPETYVTMAIALEPRTLLFDRNGDAIKDSAMIKDVPGRIVFARDERSLGTNDAI